jgi:hypothetical protein
MNAGPWAVEHWTGGKGVRKGFYVARSVSGFTEWAKTARKALLRFDTRAEAEAWIASTDEAKAESARKRLIAAAPDLLKELRLLNLDANGEQRKNTPAWLAIAKATGSAA